MNSTFKDRRRLSGPPNARINPARAFSIRSTTQGRMMKRSYRGLGFNKFRRGIRCIKRFLAFFAAKIIPFAEPSQQTKEKHKTRACKLVCQAAHLRRRE